MICHSRVKKTHKITDAETTQSDDDPEAQWQHISNSRGIAAKTELGYGISLQDKPQR